MHAGAGRQGGESGRSCRREMMRGTRALASVLAVLLAGCGSVQQRVHVQRDVEQLDARTRFAPIEVSVPDDLELPGDACDAFDATLRGELSSRGLTASMGEPQTLEVRPAVVSWKIEGGVDNSFFATEGHAVIMIGVTLTDRDGRRVGHFRVTERSEVTGALPRVLTTQLLQSAAEALVEELEATVEPAHQETR